jgi:hypothetical protein
MQEDRMSGLTSSSSSSACCGCARRPSQSSHSCRDAAACSHYYLGMHAAASAALCDIIYYINNIRYCDCMRLFAFKPEITRCCAAHFEIDRVPFTESKRSAEFTWTVHFPSSPRLNTWILFPASPRVVNLLS